MEKKPANHVPGDEQNTDILINVLLDRSGSMSGRETDVIGHFNKFIAEQKVLPGKALVSLVIFDTEYEEVYIAKDIREVPKLTSNTYYARGGTALLDAFGKLILAVDAIKNKSSKVLFVINTDGEENSSTEFSQKRIKEMVTERSNNHDWEFLFIGAGIDAFSQASGIGLRGGQTFTGSATLGGYNNIAMYTNSYTTNFRTTGARGQAFTNATVDSVADSLVDDFDAPLATGGGVTAATIKKSKSKKSVGSNGSI